jgi:hypothetical protein
MTEKQKVIQIGQCTTTSRASSCLLNSHLNGRKRVNIISRLCSVLTALIALCTDPAIPSDPAAAFGGGAVAVITFCSAPEKNSRTRTASNLVFLAIAFADLKMRARTQPQQTKRVPDATEETVDKHQDATALGPKEMALAPFALALFSFAAVIYFDVTVPIVIQPRSDADFHVFNTRSHLESLSQLGPRVVGAPVNEVDAPKLLLSTLRAISPAAGCLLETDVQHPSGTFRHDGFLGGFTSVYANLTNVVAKISWPDTARANAPALLINAHYDSSGAGAGSSDDGLGVAAMLELARALAVGPPLGFPVVMLFDGAEETNQQGAHGFITQHKWAVDTDQQGVPKREQGVPKIGLVVDLESMGAGGRMLMFQCNSYRVARLYGQVALQPYGTVIAHELFAGLLWRVAASNFKTYLDHGPKNLIGFDNAYIERGDVYHTKYDDTAHIPDHTIYQTGHNLLSFVRGVDTIDEGDHFGLDPADGGGLRPLDSGAVFFDFLHLIWVCYTGFTCRILHLSVAIAGAVTCVHSFSAWGSVRGYSIRHYVAAVAFELLTLLRAIAASAAVGVVCMCLAPMKWYSIHVDSLAGGGGMVLVMALYAPPALIVCIRRRDALASLLLQQLERESGSSTDGSGDGGGGNKGHGSHVVNAPADGQLPGALCEQTNKTHVNPLVDPRSYSAHALQLHDTLHHRLSAVFATPWWVLLLLSVMGGLGSGYICVPWVVAAVASRFFMEPSFGLYVNPGFSLSLYAPALTLVIQSAHILLTMAMPLLGRTGAVAPPDPIVAIVIGLFIVLGSGLLSPGYHACTACEAAWGGEGGKGGQDRATHRALDFRLLVLPSFRSDGGSSKSSANGSDNGGHGARGGRSSEHRGTDTIADPTSRGLTVALAAVPLIAFLFALPRGSYGRTSPKRLWIQHTLRRRMDPPLSSALEYHSSSASSASGGSAGAGKGGTGNSVGMLEDAGVWVTPFDFRALAPLQGHGFDR